jgi:hypothetical protein
MTTYDEWFAAAVELSDRKYSAAEDALVAQGADAAAFLRARASDEVDGFRRFIATAIADYIEGAKQPLKDALGQIDAYQAGMRGTPAGGARPSVAADLMTEAAGATIVTVVALRLVKKRSWPPWKQRAALTYLERFPMPVVEPAVARFAASTREPGMRRVATDLAMRLARLAISSEPMA